MSADTAVIIVDVQESFRHASYWDEADLPAFIERTQALLDGAKVLGIPILQVFHQRGNGPFAEGSDYIKTLAPLSFEPTKIFRKSRHSSIVGTGLDVWLTEHGIRRVLVCGIRTEQCCETTTRHASDLGFEVDFVSEATLTFPMTDASGRVWSADEIKARTELVLAGRFARIATVEEALAGRPAAKAA
jgi:nicotinamidase-related amidase